MSLYYLIPKLHLKKQCMPLFLTKHAIFVKNNWLSHSFHLSIIVLKLIAKVGNV